MPVPTPDNNLNDYQQKLLQGWEEVYKKGQLTLWIMLALKDGPKHMAEIKRFIAQATHQTLSADDQSMYRALRRYHDAELIEFISQPGNSGPDRKIYNLSTTGHAVLNAFTKRNITDVLYRADNKNLIEGDS